jgi:hypothetical protein
LLPEALSEALSRVIAEKNREWQIRLDVICAEARATIADLNRVVAEKGAEILALKAEFRERFDAEVARVSAALATVKNGEDAAPEAVAEIVTKRVSDDLSAMIRGEVEAIGSDIKEMSEGFEARVDARISERVSDVPALVATAVDETIVSRGILGIADVDKKVSLELAKLAPPLTEEQIRSIATAAAVASVQIPKDGRDGIDGKDGLSVTPDDIEPILSAQVAAAFATFPVAKDGHTPTAEELQPVIDAAIQSRWDAMPKPKDGVDGRDGKDAAPLAPEQIVEAIRSVPELFEEAAARYLADNPPKDGRDGTDGAPGDPGPAGQDAAPVTKEQIVEAVLACDDALAAAVTKHLTDNPPAPGRDGTDGAPGPAGQDAAPVDYDSLRKFIVERVAEIPLPKDGINGIDGAPGMPGRDAEPIGKDQIIEAVLSCGAALQEAVAKHLTDNPPLAGQDGKNADPVDYEAIHSFVIERVAEIPVPKDGVNGIDGKDGVGLAGAFINRSGSLVVTLSSGSVHELGAVEGKSADPTEIKEMIRSELHSIEVKTPDIIEAPFSPHLLTMIEGAHRALSEPLIVRTDDAAQPPFTLNVNGSGAAPKPTRKTIKTRRDEHGNLEADIIESPV